MVALHVQYKLAEQFAVSHKMYALHHWFADTCADAVGLGAMLGGPPLEEAPPQITRSSCKPNRSVASGACACLALCRLGARYDCYQLGWEGIVNRPLHRRSLARDLHSKLTALW